MGTVSTAVYRKAVEIVNRGDVEFGNNQFTVYREDTGTVARVTPVTTKSGVRFRSNDKYFRNTGRQSTYITAVKLALGIPVTVRT